MKKKKYQYLGCASMPTFDEFAEFVKAKKLINKIAEDKINHKEAKKQTSPVQGD